MFVFVCVLKKEIEIRSSKFIIEVKMVLNAIFFEFFLKCQKLKLNVCMGIKKLREKKLMSPAYF